MFYGTSLPPLSWYKGTLNGLFLLCNVIWFC